MKSESENCYRFVFFFSFLSVFLAIQCNTYMYLVVAVIVAVTDLLCVADGYLWFVMNDIFTTIYDIRNAILDVVFNDPNPLLISLKINHFIDESGKDESKENEINFRCRKKFNFKKMFISHPLSPSHAQFGYPPTIIWMKINNGFFLLFPLNIHRWYFRKIKRIEAEKKLLLPENEHGAFLIRDSESRHNDYSLSGKWLI